MATTKQLQEKIEQLEKDLHNERMRKGQSDKENTKLSQDLEAIKNQSDSNFLKLEELSRENIEMRHRLRNQTLQKSEPTIESTIEDFAQNMNFFTPDVRAFIIGKCNRAFQESINQVKQNVQNQIDELKTVESLMKVS